MSNIVDSVASSSERKPDYWPRRVVERAVVQILLGINGLLLLLLIGIFAIAYVVAIKEHYETLGAFIDLLRWIAAFHFMLYAVVLLLIRFSIVILGPAKKTGESEGGAAG